jgi:D-cysteine desulfhydrase
MKEIKKINIALMPTPLEVCQFENKKFLLKRDDLTGCELSGNKIRKLEYLLADAKKNKADIVFTCGGEQSNHARAVAIAAKKIRLNTKLFLWGNNNSKIRGNLFLNKINNAEIKFLNKKEYDNVNEIMIREANNLKKRGLNAYIIPEGGSNVIGIYGYFDFISELSKQIDLAKVEGIVAAAGSGGTAAGILAGISLLNLKTKVIVVNVLYDEETIRKKIINLAQAFINQYKMSNPLAIEQLNILDGYSKEGYKKIHPNKIKLLLKFVSETGILFDPVYTGKAFYAYYENFLTKNLGMKYLFVHTGGLFGIFGREKEYLL